MPWRISGPGGETRGPRATGQTARPPAVLMHRGFRLAPGKRDSAPQPGVRAAIVHAISPPDAVAHQRAGGPGVGTRRTRAGGPGVGTRRTRAGGPGVGIRRTRVLRRANKVFVGPGTWGPAFDVRNGRSPTRPAGGDSMQPHPPPEPTARCEEPDDHPAAHPCPRGRHRRGDRRRQRRLPPGQARLDRHRAPRAQAAHQRNHLARGRPGDQAARHVQHDPARRLRGGVLPGRGARDRPVHRLPHDRLHPRGQDRGALDRGQARHLDGPGLRLRRAADRRGRSEADVAADGRVRDRGRRLPAGGRDRRPHRCHPRDRQGVPAAWRPDLRAHQGHRRADEGWPGDRRPDRGRRDRLRGRRQLRRDVGP